MSSSSSFHCEEELFRRADGAVPQTLGVVAGKHELHRAEEPGVELRLLIREVLTDAIADAHAAVLQLQNGDSDAIHIQHDVGPPLLVPLERHLLGNSEIVLLRLLPVDEVDGFRHLARLGLHGHAVAQQVVDSVVVAVKPAAVVIRFGAESVESRADLRRRVTALVQPCREQALFDVAVAVAVSPVADIAVVQLVAEQGDHPILGGAFGLAHACHFSTSQWPPLRGPTRRSHPSWVSLALARSTVRTDFPI